MAAIGLFFPSFVSMAFYMKISKDTVCKWQTFIIRYGVYVLLNTLITQISITYLIRISDVTESAFKSFPFFIKYVLIALVFAVVLPFLEEMLKKYLSVSIKISTDKENQYNEKE